MEVTFKSDIGSGGYARVISVDVRIGDRIYHNLCMKMYYKKTNMKHTTIWKEYNYASCLESKYVDKPIAVLFYNDIAFRPPLDFNINEYHLEFLLMRRRSGINLSRISFANKITLCTSLIEATSYIHSRGYIHRDISLSNVLIDEKYSCKIIDFGLSCKMHRLGYVDKCCKARYRAPEITEVGLYNQSIDDYSIGILIYEILSEKRAPRRSDPTIEMITRLSNVPTTRGMISLCGLLSKNPQRRQRCIDVMQATVCHPQSIYIKANTELNNAIFYTQNKTGVDDNVICQRMVHIAYNMMNNVNVSVDRLAIYALLLSFTYDNILYTSLDDIARLLSSSCTLSEYNYICKSISHIDLDYRTLTDSLTV
jgi:serine/threonine protein kinase